MSMQTRLTTESRNEELVSLVSVPNYQRLFWWSLELKSGHGFISRLIRCLCRLVFPSLVLCIFVQGLTGAKVD